MTVVQDIIPALDDGRAASAGAGELERGMPASAPWQIAVRSRLGQLELIQRLLGNVGTPDGEPKRHASIGPGVNDASSRPERAAMMAAQAAKRIEAAKVAANRQRTLRDGHRARAWWRGSDIEKAWTETHAAEALIVAGAPIGCERSVPVILDAVAVASQRLKPNDPRLVELQRATKDLPDKPETITESVVGLAATTLAAAYEAAGLEQRQVRNFRNVLIMMSIVLSLFAGLLALVPVFWNNVFSMCWDSPTQAGQVVCPILWSGPTGGDVAAVELMGLIGATITGALAVRRIRGTATPYAVPMLSLIVKLPIGALTAVGSLLLLHLLTAFSVHSSVELAAYAMIFGASQQAFTRLIDKQAQNVLDSVPTAGKDSAKDATGPT